MQDAFGNDSNNILKIILFETSLISVIYLHDRLQQIQNYNILKYYIYTKYYNFVNIVITQVFVLNLKCGFGKLL